MKQNGEEELHATEGLVRQCGGLMRLLVPQDMMMVMMISIKYTFSYVNARLKQTAFSLCIVTNTQLQIKKPVK